MIKSKIEPRLLKKQIEEKINDGQRILDDKNSDPKTIIQKTNYWEKDVINFLESNIIGFPENLTSEIKYVTDESISKGYFIGVHEMEKDTSQYREHLFDKLKKKIIEFKKAADYLYISEIVNENTNPLLTTIEEKIDFILQKLHILFNDNFYSISMIFKINEVEFRESEPEEIAENLKRRGYGITMDSWPPNDLLKISVKGAAYIERKNKASNEKLKTKSDNEINEKIDIVLSKLEEIGFGQEIIFNEIEELRNLSKKLSKKTWSQLVKGKVIDLAISELINKDVASFIYESLVEGKFKLLK